MSLDSCIINFGSINIDLIYKVENLVQVGQTISSYSFNKGPGGKGANQSVAISKAGGKVYHVGKVGNDGQFLIENMEASKVNCQFIKYCEVQTGTAIIQVDKNGDNGILVFEGANGQVNQQDIFEALHNVSNISYVLIQNELKISNLVSIEAVKLGLPVVFNPSPITSTLLEQFPWNNISYLIVNQGELSFFYDTVINQNQSTTTSNKDLTVLEKSTQLVQYLTSLPETKLQYLIVTLGKDPVLVLNSSSENRFVQVPNLNLEVVDTTGAGDCFLGYFLATLAQKTNIDFDGVTDAIYTANIAAALAVTRNGATSSIPELNEVLDKINS